MYGDDDSSSPSDDDLGSADSFDDDYGDDSMAFSASLTGKEGSEQKSSGGIAAAEANKRSVVVDNQHFDEAVELIARNDGGGPAPTDAEGRERLQGAIQRAARTAHATKTALAQHLGATGLGAEQVAHFRAVWEAEGAALLAALRERTLGGPKVLTGLDYRVHLQMGQTNASGTVPSTIRSFETCVHINR